MKKIILGTLVLAGIVTSCEKEEVNIEKTPVQETIVQNENTRRCECPVEVIHIVSSMEIWVRLRQLADWAGGITDPDNDESFDKEEKKRAHISTYQDLFTPILGEGNVHNVIEGIWTIAGSGGFEVGSVYTLKFLEEGETVEIFEFLTVER